MASFLGHSAALVAALAVLPQLVGEFWAYTLALYFLYAIASLGIGLCWGQAEFCRSARPCSSAGGYLSGCR